MSTLYLADRPIKSVGRRPNLSPDEWYLVEEQYQAEQADLQARWDSISSEFDSKGFYLITDPDEARNATELYEMKLRYICHCGNETYTTYRNLHKIKGCWECQIKSPWITDEDRLLARRYTEYNNWRAAVYKRDNYTCQICCNKGKIHAHHLDGYGWCRERRTDISNGITLCTSCHMQFHSQFGRLNNTEQQFIKFRDSFKKVS